MPTGAQPVVLGTYALASGGHAVAWRAGTEGAVHVQRFDALGRPEGAPVAIAADLSLAAPAVAVLPDASIVLAVVAGGAASVDEPWITRTAVSVQRYDTHGGLLGDAMQLGALEQNRIGAETMRYVTEPAIARWDDGGFVVAWSQVEEDATGRAPQFFGQRFDAAARPAGGTVPVGPGDRDTGLRLAATPSGGWLLTTFHRIFGRTFLRVHAFDGAAAPVLSEQAIGIAEGSLLLPLAGGRAALLSPAHVYGSLRMYGADGEPLGMAGALAAMPAAAFALHDGGFVTFSFHEGQLLAQRYDAAGRASGDPVPAAAGVAALHGTGLAGGGLAVAWPGAAEVLVQRLR